MALTQPFINSIPAFDATQSNNLTLSVLGGNIITSYQFWIYLQSDSSLVYTSPTLTPSTTDISTETIRTFNLPIPANTCTNNNTYYIVAQTFNPDLDDYTYSPLSSQSLFVCYVAPSFGVFLSVSDVYEDITTLTPPQISASSAELKLVFNTNDINSPAMLNEAKIQLLGVDSSGNSNLLFDGDYLYNEPLVQTITGFLPTLTSGGSADPTAIYSSFTLSITGTTIENLEWTQNITDLQCYYSTISSSLDFLVTNLCDEGTMKIESNIPFYDTTVEYLTIEYKENTSANNWITIQTVNRSSTASIFANFNFYFYFPYCANNKVYDFRMTLFGSDGSQINSYTQTVVSTFYKSYIADTTEIYPLYEDWKRSGAQTIQKSAIYEPYGSVFPFVAYNALTKYKQGTDTAILLASTSQQQTSSYIDRMAQVMLENEFNAWLTNRRGKILKTFNGDVRIVSVHNSISNEYFSELGNGLASTSFDWIEISDFTQTNLNKTGMVNNFNINYFIKPEDWTTKTWNGLTNFRGRYVWTDGDNYYYSGGDNQYVLDKATSTWTEKTWIVLTSFYGSNVWKDGDIIYYSATTSQYVLDKATSTWVEKTWIGLTYFAGNDIWTDGDNIYYSNGGQQYVLDKATSTWTEKTWVGLTNFDGEYIWTNGDNYYYSSGTSQYVLDKATSTWSEKTWVGLSDFYGVLIWTDGDNIYCSSNVFLHEAQYVLDKATSTWSEKTWVGLTNFSGQYIWKDGDIIYYSYEATQYVLYNI